MRVVLEVPRLDKKKDGNFCQDQARGYQWCFESSREMIEKDERREDGPRAWCYGFQWDWEGGMWVAIAGQKKEGGQVKVYVRPLP